MPIEHEVRDGALVWVRNPITGVVSYVVDVRGKSFAFTLGGREELQPTPTHLSPEEIRHTTAACPFCPGNEAMAPPEILRVTPTDFPNWNGGDAESKWVMRVFNNLFPRIPAQLTNGRNESYVVVEDPRHFGSPTPHSVNDLLFTGLLSEEHFFRLLTTDIAVMRHAMSNPTVKSIVIRKNQGRESGASQPHLHQQVIGAPGPLPAPQLEARAQAENPKLWVDTIELVERLGMLIERRDGVVSYASPIGAFPRSYDVIMPDFRATICDLEPERLRQFSRAIYRILKIVGPLPLDYEIHQGENLPLHAHINGRLYPYSNVAGTLNLPSVLPQNVAAMRRALERHKDY